MLDSRCLSLTNMPEPSLLKFDNISYPHSLSLIIMSVSKCLFEGYARPKRLGDPSLLE